MRPVNALEKASIGRANMMLVHGPGPDPPAVASSVIAEVRDETSGQRITFTGPVTFAPLAARHIREVILPTVDRITGMLGLPHRCYGLSAVNLGAASAADTGTNISGLSSDLAVFLALLSAALQLPVPEDVVSTGHLASAHGDIRAVKSVPAKLKAAIAEPTMKRFVHPGLEGDSSLAALSPAEAEAIASAVAEAKGKITIRAVSNVAEFMEAVFPEEAIVLASLRSRFLSTQNALSPMASPVGRAATFLAMNNEQRFWNILERSMLAGDNRLTQELIAAWTSHFVKTKAYPKQFGRQLRQLIQSLPPTTRRLKNTFPLCTPDALLALCHFATADDIGDMHMLFDAQAGGMVKNLVRAEVAVRPTVGRQPGIENVFDSVLSLITPGALSKRIGGPIDAARASYVMDSITAESNEEFQDAVTAFYLHLARHCLGIGEPANWEAAAREGLALLKRAFADDGGVTAARAEGRDAVRGGLRYVLDRLTATLQREEEVKFVDLVLKEALDPLDWQEKVAFTEAFIHRVAPHLPPEILAEPPERFAKSIESLVRTYVKSLEQVNLLMKSL